MSLQSQFTRIKAMIDALLGDELTQTDDQKMALIREVLEMDMPQYVSRGFATIDKVWTFRAMDSGEFRLIEKGILNDALVWDAGLGDASVFDHIVMEAVPWDMEGNQLALGMISIDKTGSGSVILDLCVDADADSVEAGSWLFADEGVSLGFDTEIELDVYPTRSLVVKLTNEPDVEVRALRARFSMMGSRELLTQHGNMIANLGVARFFDIRYQQMEYHGNHETARGMKSLALSYRNKALGVISEDSDKGGASAGGMVTVGGGLGNRYWDSFKNQVGSS